MTILSQKTLFKILSQKSEVNLRVRNRFCSVKCDRSDRHGCFYPKKKTGTVAIMFTSKSYFGFHPESSMILQCKSVTLKSLRLRLDSADKFAFVFCLLFFFSHVCETCGYCSCTVHEQQPQNLTFLTFFSQSVHTVHCLWTHKFHFSTTFSLKMGLTVLFTHLKIILLQCFQFSAK